MKDYNTALDLSTEILMKDNTNDAEVYDLCDRLYAAYDNNDFTTIREIRERLQEIKDM